MNATSNFVTRAELGDVLQAIGSLTREVSQLNLKVDALILDLRSYRRKMKSLPELVAHAIDKDHEITAVTNLRRELAESKRQKTATRNAAIGVVAGALSIMVGGLILHYIFHIG